MKSFLIAQDKSETSNLKTKSKRTIQEREKATGNLIRNKTVDKITSIASSKPQSAADIPKYSKFYAETFKKN